MISAPSSDLTPVDAAVPSRAAVNQLVAEYVEALQQGRENCHGVAAPTLIARMSYTLRQLAPPVGGIGIAVVVTPEIAEHELVGDQAHDRLGNFQYDVILDDVLPVRYIDFPDESLKLGGLIELAAGQVPGVGGVEGYPVEDEGGVRIVFLFLRPLKPPDGAIGPQQLVGKSRLIRRIGGVSEMPAIEFIREIFGVDAVVSGFRGHEGETLSLWTSNLVIRTRIIGVFQQEENIASPCVGGSG